MNAHYNKVKNNEEKNIEFMKTEEEWDKYKIENEINEYIEENKIEE